MLIDIPSRKNTPATQIFVQCEGDKSAHPILLLPGGPGGNATTYDVLVPKLIKHYRVIRFDPRGCARSPRTASADPAYCTIDHYVDDIASIKQTLNINQFSLLGASYGAMAALLYATKYVHQEDLRCLVLLGGAASHAFITQAQTILQKKHQKQQCSNSQLSWMKKLFSGNIIDAEDFRQYYKAMENLYFATSRSKTGTPAHVVSSNKVYDYYVEITNQAFRTNGFLRTFNIENKLSVITCPTLAIFGENDWINPPELGNIIINTLKKHGNHHAFFHQIKQCGHFPELEQPKIFFPILLKFLFQYALDAPKTR